MKNLITNQRQSQQSIFTNNPKYNRKIRRKKVEIALDIMTNYLTKATAAEEAEIYFVIGNIELYRKKYHLACIALEKAIEGNFTGDSRLYKNYARSQKEMQNYDVANQMWEKYFEMVGVEELETNDYFNYGDTLVKLGKLDDAIPLLNQAVQLDPNKKVKSIWQLYKTREEWPTAIFFLKLELEKNESENLLFELSEAYFYSFDYENCIDTLQKLTKISDADKYKIHLARAYENIEEYQKSIECWTQLDQEKFRKKPFYIYRMAFCLYKLGNFKEATKYFEMYSSFYDYSLDTDTTSEFYFKGQTKEQEEDYVSAIIEYQKALFDTQDHNPVLFASLGNMLTKVERYEEACETYKFQKLIMTNGGMRTTPFKREHFKRHNMYNVVYENTNINKDVIYYCSYNGASFSGSPYALFKQLKADPNLIHIIALQDNVAIPSHIDELDNVYIVRYHTFAHMRAMSIAKKIIIDSTLPFYFIAKDEQIILNTWHGTPIKNLGYEMLELGYHSSRNVRKCLDTATHFINPNQFTEDVMTRSYTLSKDQNTNYAITGYPRQDLMLNASDELKASLRQKLGIDADKKVVLYAPTFRGTGNESNGKIHRQMKKAIKKMRKSTEYHLLYKGHYFEPDTDKKLMDIDSNELLSIVDVLVTDYSSIGIDYLALDKPVINFVFDLEEYRTERGLYINIDEISDNVVTEYKELLKVVSEQIKTPNVGPKQAAAKAKYCNLDDGNATSRVIEFMEQEKQQVATTKKEILIYSGNILLTNGITRAFENLVTAINKDEYNITILITANLVYEVKDYPILDRLYNQGYKIIIKYGPHIMSLEENYAQNKYNQYLGFVNETHKQKYLDIQKKAAKRLFGNLKFDAVINYESGYTPDVHAFLTQVQADTHILVLHNDLMGEAKIRFPHLRKTFELYNNYDHIWTVSEAVNQQNIKKIGLPYNVELSKFGVLNNVIDYKSIQAAAQEPLEVEADNKLFEDASTVFISVGRLSPEKNQELAIRSFAEVMKHTGDTKMKLLIFGIGGLELHTREVINSLGLNDSVHLMGIRSNPFNYLQKSDVFVFPSLHEGQPLVLFEALLTDTPIITSDIPPNVEFVEKYGGVYTEKTVEAFSQAMIDFVEGRMDTSNSYDPVDYNKNILNVIYEAMEK